MERTKWTERKFTFDFPEGWMFNVIERLHGTPARLRELTYGLAEDSLQLQLNGKWSIKQEIGHLIDLEDLHEGRLDDFLTRKEMLRAADMKNLQTENANHNDRDAEELISAFQVKRKKFIARLLTLDDETLTFKSTHPRLQVLMRPVDVAFFTSEHDDHHLASIREKIHLQA